MAKIQIEHTRPEITNFIYSRNDVDKLAFFDVGGYQKDQRTKMRKTQSGGYIGGLNRKRYASIKIEFLLAFQALLKIDLSYYSADKIIQIVFGKSIARNALLYHFAEHGKDASTKIFLSDDTLNFAQFVSSKMQKHIEDEEKFFNNFANNTHKKNELDYKINFKKELSELRQEFLDSEFKKRQQFLDLE